MQAYCHWLQVIAFVYGIKEDLYHSGTLSTATCKTATCNRSLLQTLYKSDLLRYAQAAFGQLCYCIESTWLVVPCVGWVNCYLCFSLLVMFCRSVHMVV